MNTLIVSLDTIKFAHFGNGISVYTTQYEYRNDYLTIAFIDKNRKVSYPIRRKGNAFEERNIDTINSVAKQLIEKYAITENPVVSITQSDEYVFATKV